MGNQNMDNPEELGTLSTQDKHHYNTNNIRHEHYFKQLEVKTNRTLNNSKFSDYVDRVFPIELETENTTNTTRSALYLDLHL